MKLYAALTLLLAAAPFSAFADVADSSANGFTVKISMRIQAPPADVYGRLFHIADWWNPQHTFSGDARNLTLDNKPGGCLCEKLPDNGGVRHLEVIHAAPGKVLVLKGGLGPLQSMAADGTMTFRFAPDGDGTTLTLIYAVTGYSPAGMNALAVPVNLVLTEQLSRLKSFVEKGAVAK